MGNFFKEQGLAATALVVAIVSTYYSCEQRDAAKKANELADAANKKVDVANAQTEQALLLAKDEAAKSSKRDRANVNVVIQSQYKDVLSRADGDCTIQSWLEDPCPQPNLSRVSDRDRTIWIRDLLMWMETVYVQTAALDERDARAWRADVQSYFRHPEICKRTRARMEGNSSSWEDVFWSSVPENCRGPSTALPAKAVASPVSIKDVKAKLSVGPDVPDVPRK